MYLDLGGSDKNVFNINHSCDQIELDLDLHNVEPESAIAQLCW